MSGFSGDPENEYFQTVFLGVSMKNKKAWPSKKGATPDQLVFGGVFGKGPVAGFYDQSLKS